MTHPYDNPFARRTLLKGAAGLSLAGLLGAATACGNSGGGSSSKTLTMLYFGEQKAATELQNRLQPEISKLDPTITFQVSAINGTDWNDFLAKVLTQVAAGTPPDLISVATEGLQLMAQKELAVPLDDYITKDMADLKTSYFADVHPALIESMMYQGHLWELPDSFNAGNMFYNTKLFEQAGVDAPAAGWTIDDFENAAAKSAALKGVNGFGWVVRLWGSWTSFMYANNANLLEEGKYDGGDWLWKAAYAGDPAAAGRKGGWKWGAPTANSAGTVEALDYMIQLNKKGLSPKPDVGGGGTLQGLFASDRIGMAIGGGFWAGGLTNAGMKKGSFDVQLFPKWQSQRHLFGAGGYAIFKSVPEEGSRLGDDQAAGEARDVRHRLPGQRHHPGPQVLDDRRAVLHDRSEELVGVLRHADQAPRHGADPCPALLQRDGHRPQPAHHPGHVLR